MLADPISAWKKAPFLRILPPVITGIVLQDYFGFSILFIAGIALTVSLALILFRFLSITIQFRMHSIRGLLINVMLINIALLATWKNDIRNTPKWFGHNEVNNKSLVAILEETPVVKARSIRAYARVIAIADSNEFKPATGRIILYFPRDTTLKLKPGATVIIRKECESIQNKGNPGGFNYKRYAALQQVFHTAHIKTGEWNKIDYEKENYLAAMLGKAKEYVLDVLDNHLSGDEKGLAEALIIGYKEDLDKDLLQAYSNTGVVHVIAISGLHLGLIYLILTWIFRWLPTQKIKWLNAFLVIAILWWFSLLTGGSASVLRSAVMFTFLVIGNHFSKQANVFNSLAASAFFLLIYNPCYLWDIGFQLSYLALAGIVLLQQPIRRILFSRQKWLNKIGELVSVTLAAQVFTFPVCLYYFHQFPLLFLLTNVIAVPLSSLILVLGIFLVSISWIPVLPGFTGNLLNLLIRLMNLFIQKCNEIPYSILEGFHLSLAITYLLYALIIAICAGLLNRSKAGFKIALITFLLISIILVWEKWETSNQRKLIIYQVPGKTAIDLIRGNSFSIIGNKQPEANLLIKRVINPARLNLGLTKKIENPEPGSKGITIWKYFVKCIVIIDSTFRYDMLSSSINADVLIITGNPGFSLKNVYPLVNPGQVVLDGSNSLWKIAQWQRACEELHLPCFSTPHKGAYVLDIK